MYSASLFFIVFFKYLHIINMLIYNYILNLLMQCNFYIYSASMKNYRYVNFQYFGKYKIYLDFFVVFSVRDCVLLQTHLEK